MEYKIFTAEHFKPSNWAGGTTTELFIFPSNANYQLRNFLFRLSTATVEMDKSVFTPLNGISRKLMVLAGQITLSHEGHHSKQLNKFNVDEFEGAWKTSSIGRCTDFNLMTTGKTTGEITAIVVEKEKQANYKIKENFDWCIVYIYSGKINIALNNKTIAINKGDLLLFNKPTITSLKITGVENSELVISEIYISL